ncbi:low affinity immunoglobulin gamma Fc region receptor II-a isoform X1 [Bos javanicus]|uniref:low affinity immunoglobulin gamma Fc region receptor II-a isoform X1 n=1 Tax=Bos javanicus TaxID=9906 RepID=UPI002AA88A88|nr:low affinity immunoglobulin gamma Fc region receptor II-a isoform X1 [Bos javanicus]
MGIPSFLAFPAARRNRPHCTPWHPWGHMLLWTALPFLAPVPGKCADLPKAVVSIQPAWINVLREDHVTLMCQGTSFSAGNLTTWFHNGSSIHTQKQPSYSFRAGSNDSGSYRCQREQTSLSDPVHLDVISDWLLLQTPSLVFQEGEPIMLRCHSWRNQPLNKITFYQDRKSKIFSYQRTNFSIPRANLSHSGQYHCTAFIGKMLHSSQPVNITVQDGNEEQMCLRSSFGKCRSSTLFGKADRQSDPLKTSWGSCLLLALAWVALQRLLTRDMTVPNFCLNNCNFSYSSASPIRSSSSTHLFTLVSNHFLPGDGTPFGSGYRPVFFSAERPSKLHGRREE